MFKRTKEPATPIRQRHLDAQARTQAPGAFSYHSARRNEESEVISVGETGHHRGRIALIFVIALAALFESYLSTNPKVQLLGSSTALVHSPGQYQQAAAAALNQSLLNHFKFSLNSSQVTNHLESKYPEIASSAVTLPLIGTRPTVVIAVSKPVFNLVANNGTGMVDAKGVIIGMASDPSLIGLSAPANTNIQTGEVVLTPQSVAFIQTVDQALAAKSISISKSILVPGAEELDVYPKGQSYYVKFNLHQDDPLQQVGTYLATVATLSQQHKQAGQYIDVRVDGRAYYK